MKRGFSLHLQAAARQRDKIGSNDFPRGREIIRNG
jgi:hypothetical protein